MISAAAAGVLLWLRLSPPYEGVATHTAGSGATYSFRAYGPNAQNAAEAAALRALSIGNIVEGFAGSDVQRINEGAGQLVDVDPATIYLLHTALQYFDKTFGHFTVCDARAREAYGIGTPQGQVDEEAVRRLADDPGIGGLSIYYADLKAGIAEGTGLTLSSLLDAYIADQAASVAKDYSVSSAFFHVGDGAVAVGERPDGGWWTFQIPGGEGPLGVVLIKDQAVATVGAGAEKVTIGDVQYPAVIDATTMAPVSGDIQSVTVVAQSAIEAAALANALMSMEVGEGEALLRSFPDAHAVFALRDHSVYVTSGLRDRFSLRAEGFAPGNR